MGALFSVFLDVVLSTVGCITSLDWTALAMQCSCKRDRERGIEEQGERERYRGIEGGKGWEREGGERVRR